MRTGSSVGIRPAWLSTPRPLKTIAALASAVLAVVLVASPAAAGDGKDGAITPMSCQAGYSYDTFNVSDYALPMGIIFTAGPSDGNLDMSSSIEWSLSVTASVSGSVSGSVNAIVASASTTFSISVSTSASISQTWTATYNNIPNGKYGHLRFVSFGYKVSWNKWYENPNCTSTYLGGGTAILPNPSNLGFKSWASTTPNG